MKAKKPIKVRRHWGALNPATKVKQSAKLYVRARNARKKQIQKELDNILTEEVNEMFRGKEHKPEGNPNSWYLD